MIRRTPEEIVRWRMHIPDISGPNAQALMALIEREGLLDWHVSWDWDEVAGWTSEQRAAEMLAFHERLQSGEGVTEIKPGDLA